MKYLKQFLLGAILGLLLILLFRLVDVNLNELKDLSWYYWILLIPIIYIVYEISIVFHELGHYIFGKMTGYEFVSFRYKSFLLKKENNKIVLKRYSVSKTAGQCLMLPPKNASMFFYNAGGVIINLFFMIIAILLLIFLAGTYEKLISSIVLVINLMMFLINWLPLKNFSNDGNNYREVKRFENSRSVFIEVLSVNEKLSKGISLNDISLVSDFYSLDLEKPLQANMGTLIALRNLYQNNYELALEELSLVIDGINNEEHIISIIAQCYKYFLDLILTTKHNYPVKNKNVQKFLTMTKNEPSFELIKWYEQLVKENIDTDISNKMMDKLYKESIAPGEVKDLIALKDKLLLKYQQDYLERTS